MLLRNEVVNVFDPNNDVVKLCMAGLGLEAAGDRGAAIAKFQEALETARNDFERFIASFHLARMQDDIPKRLEGMIASLNFAMNSGDNGAKTALYTIYSEIAKCYEVLAEHGKAEQSRFLAESYHGIIFDKGPFFHGTRADLPIGSFLTPGLNSNYQSDLIMQHIYFTANMNGAILAATLAKGDGDKRVYIVQPTGDFEHDPNLTDQKFPGNLTQSYRSTELLKIIGEIQDLEKLNKYQRDEWLEKLLHNHGEIIN